MFIYQKSLTELPAGVYICLPAATSDETLTTTTVVPQPVVFIDQTSLFDYPDTTKEYFLVGYMDWFAYDTGANLANCKGYFVKRRKLTSTELTNFVVVFDITGSEA